MSIEENILRETYNYNGPFITEDFALTKFVKGFAEDYKLFGENTADVYKALFMLDESVRVDLLQENIESVNEAINNLKTPFLFEGYITERGGMLNRELEGSSEAKHTTASLQDAIKKEYLRKEAEKAAAKTAGAAAAARDISVPKKGFLQIDGGANKVPQTIPEYGKLASPSGMKTAAELGSAGKSLAISGGQAPAELKKTLEAAIAAPDSASAVKILSQAQSGGGGAAAVGAVKAAGGAKVAAGAAAKVAPKGILGWVGQAFGKVKNFFTGGVSSVGAAIKSGNWGALMKIPLVQGALAAGGAVLAFKLLKKLFGKKIRPEQEAQLQASLQKGGK